MCELDKKNKGRRIDECMKNLISRMTGILSSDFKTVACCCGHGKYPMTIILKERHYGNIHEFFTGKPIMRKRKFYKRDNQGYYYIPEIIKKNGTTGFLPKINLWVSCLRFYERFCSHCGADFSEDG